MTKTSQTSRVRFALAGPSENLDPRINAYRADIADMALAGRIFAHYYAHPSVRQCIVPHAPLHEGPDRESTMTSELLFGEGFAVIDRTKDWVWGFCTHDHYVGYLPADAIGEADAPDHIVVVAKTAAHLSPDMTADTHAALTMGARLSGSASGNWLETSLGFVPLADLAALETTESDPVTVAEQLIETPYLWGGRGAAGIDCSGLVQIALGLFGTEAPRDSDMQMASLGEPLADDAVLKRGDIVFFPDHVGWMADPETLLHAAHHHGKVVYEPLEDVVARIGQEHDRPVLARKRLV
ncbi:NlpC/P60 family protein [uncultured Parasphingopyxis sp.]|uniref:C40 family peptidase n=1 Tax=uncultured Parasphingopyxis sp. TaxID=1547918 RepID=UPI00261A552F|nr:NlpC/P60 family protein [uncultured Parasphingopyxis sp.]